MRLSDLLNEKTIIPDLKSTEKNDVINELIDLFRNDARVNDIEKVRQKVLAVPHGKTDAVNDIICAFGKSTRPIEYQSLDQQPVHLIFLLVGQDNSVSLHIKLLSRISRMMTKDDFRDKLLKAKTTEEIRNAFVEEEKDYIDL
jgi:mannitol/fructose-specific phosphotransferase system IIA component (Ntr-type)